MNGLLFYDEIGAKRNRWFIERLIDVAAECGCELRLVVTSDVDVALSFCEPRPNFAIVRTISPMLSHSLEALGIPTFNNARTAEIANDKWLTYLYAEELGVPVMHTEEITESAGKIHSLVYPFVVKAVDGHGGSEVFLVNNTEECKQILAKNPNKRFIAQELSSEPGIDMRVYVLGGEVLKAVCRTSKTDFRSNFSLGGKAEGIALDEKEAKIVSLISTNLGADLIGIDFIRHNGEWILNEIEDVVGTRMLYSLTDIDAAEVYVKHIISKIKQH